MTITKGLLFAGVATLAIVAVSCDKADKPAAAPTAAEKPAALTPLDEAKTLLGTLSKSLEKVVTTLEGVTDKASAETAAATIKSVSAELKSLTPKAQAIKETLPDADKQAMETEAMPAMKPWMGRMSEVMQKVMADPEVASVLGPVMNEFSQAMAPPKSTPPSSKE